MNRKEDLINYLYEELFDPANEEIGFDRVISTIREYEEKPITLADFLGWEEDVEYEDCDELRYKIEDEGLFYFEDLLHEWTECDFEWSNIFIRELQQAKKVEPKLKAYHVKDEYSYNELMKELEEQGYDWSYNQKPSDCNYWSILRENAVIYCNKSKYLSYGRLDYYAEHETDKYNLIEYHKEEPLYYAKIKGTQIDIRGVHGLRQEFTMRGWNKLGVNDTKVDFEKVED